MSSKWLAMSAMALCCSAFAMGSGTTKIDFQVKAGDTTGTRLFIKRDVSATTSQLPTIGSKSINDNIAGGTVTLSIGSAAFTATADDKGKTTTPFAAKITGNGKGLQVMADGLNLQELFSLDMTDGDHTVSVPIKITVSFTDATTQVVTTVTLTDATVAFDYKVKKGNAKGRGY